MEPVIAIPALYYWTIENVVDIRQVDHQNEHVVQAGAHEHRSVYLCLDANITRLFRLE